MVARSKTKMFKSQLGIEVEGNIRCIKIVKTMSSFYPLNLAEDPNVSKKEIEEQHSRELQIEQAIIMYQDVLTLQKLGNLHEAYHRYVELFKLDIISNHEIEEEDFVKGLQNGGMNTNPDELAFISPNIKLLRYLIYRNRGMLYLEILKTGSVADLCSSKEVITSEQKFIELSYQLIDDFCISLIYQEADEKLLNTLYDILFYIGAYRLAKFTLEYTFTGKSESDDILGLIPYDDLIQQRYQWIKGLLSETELTKDQLENLESDRNRINSHLGFLEPLKLEFQSQINKSIKLNSVDVCLTNNMDWFSVIDAINLEIQTQQDKQLEIPRSKSKYLDLYTFTENSIERIKFRIVEEKEINDDVITQIGHADGQEANEKMEINEDTSMINEDNEIINNGDIDISDIEKENLQPTDDNTVVLFSLVDTNVLPCSDTLKEEKVSNDQSNLIENDGNNIIETENINIEISNHMKDTDAEENQEIGSQLSAEEDTDTEMKIEQNEPVNEINPQNEENLDMDESKNQESMQLMVEESKDDARLKGQNKPQRSSRRLAQSEDFDLKPEIALERIFFEETSVFYRTLNEFLLKLSTPVVDFKLSDVVEQLLPEPGDPHQNIYIADFLEALNNWEHPSYTKCLLSKNATLKTSEDEKVKLLDVLSGFAKASLEPNDESNKRPDLIEFDDANNIREYILSLNDSEMHYIELKFKILDRLLGYFELRGEQICLITSTLWSRKLFHIVKEWSIQNEHLFLQNFYVENFDARRLLPLSVCIHEILVDSCLSIQDQISKSLSQSGQKYHKPTINSLSLELVRLKGALKSWSLFIDSHGCVNKEDKVMKEVEIRYLWSCINMQKSSNIHSMDNTYVIWKLKELLKLVKEEGGSFQIQLPNYNNLPDINIKNIKGQITTLSVLSMFSRILSETNSNNPEAITLLKVILIGNKDETDVSTGQDSVITLEAINAIKTFLDNSPIDMKLSLWNILFLYYSSNDKSTEFQNGFEFNLTYLFEYLSSKDYEKLGTSSRIITLIKIIGFLNVILGLFLSIIAKNQWKLPSNKVDNSIFKVLLKYFEFFYLFSLHEEAAMITAFKSSVQKKSIASYNCLKDLFVRMTSMLLIYYKSFLLVKNGDINESHRVIGDLISVTHDQLGIRNVCDASNCMFLEMAQEILIQLQGDSKQDLAQILFCRYHYSVSIGSFTPKDHGTQTQLELDETTTKEISRFILPQCFQSNPIVNVPKHDTKGLIEDFYEVIGDPEFDNCPVLARNLAIMDDFLDNSEITPRFIRDSFHGLLDLEFAPMSKNREIIENGLYYLIGVISYSSYKIRKKSMQTRAVELENIIKVLRNDLLYNTRRVESWYLLGQAYGLLVEDDLIWTADKLTVPERKLQTSNLQRKSIICYLMAINGTVNTIERSRRQSFKPIIGNLMSAFAKELFSACLVPMDMHAFKVKMNPKFIRKDTVKFETTPLVSSVSLLLCLKVIQQSLHLAIKANLNDWTNYYYLSKVQRKLKKDPITVLETMLEASSVAFNQLSSPDRIIEPHYTICSYVYKFYKAKELNFEDAISILKRDPVIALPDDQIPDHKNRNDINFYRVVVYALKKVKAYDKKHWHHKPRYRLSKVLFDEFQDCEEAIEQMSTLVSVKANSKTLVLIWKPENERPGKHFYYTHQYAKFFIQLLAYNNDLANLIIMFPRLRRSNSIMILLYTAWESICTSVCKLIRTLIDLDTDFLFTDAFMQKLTYLSFIKNSKANLEAIQKNGIPDLLEPLVCCLYSLNDMKKFNNGFGPTSFIDDTIVALFFKIYIYFEEENKQEELILDGNANAVVDSPGGKFKKIAKRDIFPFVTEILKNSRREIETIIKEKPTIYNDFVLQARKRQEKQRVELEMNNIDNKTEKSVEQNMAIDYPKNVSTRESTPSTQIKSELGNSTEIVKDTHNENPSPCFNQDKSDNNIIGQKTEPIAVNDSSVPKDCTTTTDSGNDETSKTYQIESTKLNDKDQSTENNICKRACDDSMESVEIKRVKLNETDNTGGS